MLTFQELRKANTKRSKKWHKDGDVEWSLSDWAVAMAGEAGETCNIVKKINRDTDGLTGNCENIEELKGFLADEIADTITYLDLLANHAGIDLEDAVIRKFNVVSRRNGFPDRLGVPQ